MMRAYTKILIAAVLLMSAGCAKERKEVAQAPATPVTDSCRGDCVPDDDGSTPDAPNGTGDDPADTGFSSGSTAALNLSGGTSPLTRLFYKSNPSSPTNVRINIDLRRLSNAVIVSYIENGRAVEAHFGTIHPVSGIQNARHNGWVNQSGTSVWKGFFQDKWGAIVIVIDRTMNPGDGQQGEYVGGSIWFQNFYAEHWPYNPTQGPEKMCWEISRGPYDCRSFLVNNYVQMTSSLYPNNRGPDKTTSYEKLGDFDGIKVSEAGL